MKLSNKVLLGFLGFIFVYLTAAFAELRLTGTPNVLDDENSIAETVDLSGVEHIALNGMNHHIRIVGSDRGRLELRSPQGGLLKNLAYKISGDTLVLSEFQYEGNQRVDITVFVPKAALKRVAVNRSSASISGFEQDFLSIAQTAGRITMYENKIGSIHLDVTSNSVLSMWDSKVDTLSAIVDGSQVQVRSTVGFVSGSVTNNARMELNKMQNIQLKQDESSKLTVYQ